MIIRNESNVVGLYEAYGYRFVGCIADYESEYINIGVVRKAITKIAIIDQKTGETIYKEILGNRAIFFETFEKHCDDILYYLSKNTFDAIDLENIIDKLVKNALTLFSHNIGQQKKRDQEEKEFSEKIAVAKKEENRLEELAHDKGYELFFDDKLYIMEFDSENDRLAWNRIDNNVKKDVIKRIRAGVFNGVSILFESEYDYFGRSNELVKSGLRDAISFLNS